MEYTVIGLWYDDEPLVAGVIEGEHIVHGGDVEECSDQGLWATSVSAASPDEAEEMAKVEMSASIEADDESGGRAR